MKQLTRSEFNKQGTTYKGVTSPATDNETTQITDIVENNGNLAYSTDGSNYKTITKQVTTIQDVSEIYPSKNALPVLTSADDGQIYCALANGVLPLSMYKYIASTNTWQYIDNVREDVIYFDVTSGLLYTFTTAVPYFAVTSYTNVSQLNNDLNYVSASEMSTAIDAAVALEATARENADQTLQTNISAETSARESADTALVQDIQAETSARVAAVQSLQSSKQNLIDSANKLSADLVDDTSTTNKFVTASDKTTWNAKQDALTAGTNITISNNVISATVPQIEVDSALSTTSENPVQNKVITTALDGKQPTLTTAQQNAVDSGVTSTTVSQVATNTTDIASLSTGKQDVLTTAQQNAVNSGITSSLVSQISTNTSNISAETTARQNADTTLQTNIDAKYTKPSGGIPKTDLASDVQTSLGKADTALQGITSSDVTTALGFTPYNSTNPNGYTKVESSTTNGNIKINGNETTVYTLPNNIATTTDVTNAVATKQDTIDSSHKLSADLVDDTSTTNKFVTSAEKTQISTNTSDITTIEGLIPAQATTSNQLADKNFVNSSINALAAYYITKNAAGDPFATKAQLNSATTFYSGGVVRVPTTNDYCIVLADESKQSTTGVDPTTRYSYQGGQWEYQYTINDTPLTAAQLAALNSGITSALVTQIGTNQTDIATKQDTIDSSHKLSADLVDDTSTTNKFVTASNKAAWNAKGGVYRGTFGDWSTVPTSASGYEADANGNTTPLKDDYMILNDGSGKLDDSSFLYLSDTSGGGASISNTYNGITQTVRYSSVSGESNATTLNNVVSVYYNPPISKWIVKTLKACTVNNVSYAVGDVIAQWTYSSYSQCYIAYEANTNGGIFVYDGVWGTDGKNGWKTAASILSMTMGIQNAINDAKQFTEISQSPFHIYNSPTGLYKFTVDCTVYYGENPVATTSASEGSILLIRTDGQNTTATGWTLITPTYSYFGLIDNGVSQYIKYYQEHLTAGTGITISNNVISVDGGVVTAVDNALSTTSTNPVQNKVVTDALSDKISSTTLGNQHIKSVLSLDNGENTSQGSTTGALAFEDKVDGNTTYISEVQQLNGLLIQQSSMSGTNSYQEYVVDGDNIYPNYTDNATSLGKSGKRWKDLYLGGNLTDGTNSISIANVVAKQDAITSINKLDYSLIANTPTIPTVNNATLTVQLNGSNVQTFTANQSTNATANIQALPNYSLSIGSTNGGNPRQVLFCSVNYTNFDSNSGAYFKLGAMSGHGNGSSYTFVEDIFINVNYQGTVTCQVYKYVQQAVTLDNVARNYGDVFYTIDTTNKIVYFYILLGQYSSAQFTPGTKIGAAKAVTSANGIVQYTGTPTYYSSGTKTWATGDSATYVRSSDLATVATTGSYNDLSNKLTFDTTPTSGSTNPVTSGGVYTAIQNAASTSAIVDLIYPIGSYFITESSDFNTVAKVQAHFGGTWTQVTGRFLYGSSSAGSTGGSNDATLVSHNHTFTGTKVSSSFGYVGNTRNNMTDYTSKDGAGNQIFTRSSKQKGQYYGGGGRGDNDEAVIKWTYQPTGTISTEGSAATNANMPAYRTVYMYRRTG